MKAKIEKFLQLKPDKRIHNYEFSMSAVIGRGSYGVVYVGRNIDNGQSLTTLVALKVVPIANISNEQQALIQKEVDIMKDLDCSNIVRLIDVMRTGNNYYIISELCNGGDLREYMKRKGSLSEQTALSVILQILRGILQSFKRGIIHRDLKPANILISYNSNQQPIFKIADFGFAKRFSQLEDELMTSLVGTPLYMSPQVLLRYQYTSKCDVWSIGLIYYEMIEGRVPWKVRDIIDLVNQQKTSKIAFCKPFLVYKEAKNMSKFSQQFILGCIQYDEHNRFSWEQVFTHPLMGGTFEKKQSIPAAKLEQVQSPAIGKKPVSPGGTKSSQKVSPPNQVGNKTGQSTERQPTPKQNNYDKYFKTTACVSQPNTYKKDRTVSIGQQQRQQSQIHRFSEAKILQPVNQNAGGHNSSFASLERAGGTVLKRASTTVNESKLYHNSSTYMTEDVNKQTIQEQIEYLHFIRVLENKLVSLLRNSSKMQIVITKLQFLLSKHSMIKSTILKTNLIDKGLNYFEMKDFEQFKSSDCYNQFEKQIVENHFEIFSHFQENFLFINENLSMVINDSDFLEVFNNNFEATTLFIKLTHELSKLLIKDFLYEIICETTNVKVLSFGHALCLYCMHLLFFTNNTEIKSVLGNLQRVNPVFLNENSSVSFTSLKEDTLKSMEMLVFPQPRQ